MAPTDRQAWLAHSLCDRNARIGLLLSLALLFLPPEGIPGFEICLMRRMVGLPCPGCGLTRSGSNLARGQLRRALQFNPFGVVIIPMLFALAALALLPRRGRDAVRARLLPWGPRLRGVYLGVVAAFLVFGVWRLVGVACGWLSFPATWP